MEKDTVTLDLERYHELLAYESINREDGLIYLQDTYSYGWNSYTKDDFILKQDKIIEELKSHKDTLQENISLLKKEVDFLKFLVDKKEREVNKIKGEPRYKRIFKL